MVNSDQSANPPSVNTEIETLSNPALYSLGSICQWTPPESVFDRSQGHDVVAKHSDTQGSFGSCRSTPPDAGSGCCDSGAAAIEAIPAQSHRGDRELSSPA